MTAAVRQFWPSCRIDSDPPPPCDTLRGLGGMGGGGGMSLLAAFDAIIEFDVSGVRISDNLP